MKIRLALVFALIGLITFSAGIGTYAWYQNTYTSENDFTSAKWVVTETNIDEGFQGTQHLNDLNLEPGESDSYSFSVDVDADVNAYYVLTITKSGALFGSGTPVNLKLDGSSLQFVNNVATITAPAAAANDFVVSYSWPHAQTMNADGSSPDNAWNDLSGDLDIKIVVTQDPSVLPVE